MPPTLLSSEWGHGSDKGSSSSHGVPSPLGEEDRRGAKWSHHRVVGAAMA